MSRSLTKIERSASNAMDHGASSPVATSPLPPAAAAGVLGPGAGVIDVQAAMDNAVVKQAAAKTVRLLLGRLRSPSRAAQ
ncbi:hypothetical protein [Arthrobacter glacialis]|uniref:hypothetical protein n=1 Tax=Arthrobacter glacialis TaxID=1664 RepID=UPI001FAF7DDF|nr:hypothetical protein [Arthrobacter glacialis]